MSNSKNILYLISLMLLMLTGCEADTSIAPFPNEGEEPIEVRLHATTFGASVGVSRAETLEETTLSEGTQIGMWGGTYQNLVLNYNSGALNTTDQSKLYYPLQTETMDICAYAPYSTDAYNEEDHAIWVRSGLDKYFTTDTKYITDPIWAKTSVTKEEAVDHVINASLDFQHVMSRLQIFFIHNDNNKTYLYLNLRLKFDRVQHGKMSLETGQITTAKEIEETCEREIENITVNSDTPEYDFTILPGSVLNHISVTFKDNTSSWNFEYDFTIKKDYPAFESGKKNRIFIKLGEIDGSQQ